MQVGFESPSVGALCNNGMELTKALGDEAAESVKDLLYFLDAAPTLADLSTSPPVLRDQVTEKSPPSFSVGRAGKGQVLFKPRAFQTGQKLHDIESINVISVGGTV
jgi:hypothetical protein